MRKSWIAFLSLLLIPLQGLVAASADRAGKPNIILILADDLGYGDLGCYGQERIHTPNLDRMAREGVRFTQAYSGATVCAPSRCVLMTGRHTGHATVRGNAGTRNPMAQSLRETDITLAAVLRPADYATALIGKWGLGDALTAEPGLPRRHGFDYFFGFLNQHHAHNYYPEFLWRNETKVKLSNVVPGADDRGAGRATERREYAPDLFTEEALKFIRDNCSRSFFLYLATTIPHANNEAGKLGMEVPGLGAYANLDWPEPQKGHAAMISRLDHDVGRVFAVLKDLGIDRNTLVVFTSDNGPHKEGGFDPRFNRGSGPLRGIKRDHYEGGIRVPAIARWPGTIPAGKTSDAIWHFADVLPTFAEIAGVKAPPGIDGISMARALRGRSQRNLERRPLYWEFHEGNFKQASRWGKWKAVRNSRSAAIELYDLSKDIGEKNDLAATHPETITRFLNLFQTARTDSADWPIQGAR